MNRKFSPLLSLFLIVFSRCSDTGSEIQEQSIDLREPHPLSYLFGSTESGISMSFEGFSFTPHDTLCGYRAIATGDTIQVVLQEIVTSRLFQVVERNPASQEILAKYDLRFENDSLSIIPEMGKSKIIYEHTIPRDFTWQENELPTLLMERLSVPENVPTIATLEGSCLPASEARIIGFFHFNEMPYDGGATYIVSDTLSGVLRVVHVSMLGGEIWERLD